MYAQANLIRAVDIKSLPPFFCDIFVLLCDCALIDPKPKALLTASRALGHNRESIVAEHYLSSLKS